MRLMSSGLPLPEQEGEHKCLNSELWHACAGPLVSLPAVGTRVVYFPQGHSEQIAASTSKEIDARIPNYPTLPPELICQLHNLTMHADPDTDEVYAQMTLQPLSPQEQKDLYLPTELGTASRQPTNYFCKTLTASDTSTHGGFSVPRRAAEKVFPPLDFSQQPPAQELIAKDLHGNEWKFRHIFRGQPKRHLLTTGWSVFVSAKRLVAGDAVLFIWNESNQLLLGIRRVNRPQTIMPSSVLSSDSMHIGLLAAAAHAAATNSRFTIFYNPITSPSEFVIPLTKYVKAVYHTRVSVGMRFRMLFETEESSVRRYMGTITGISDLDPLRWSNSHWRSIKVGWDESTAGERQPRVSLWEIEPLTTFPMYPSAFPLRLKRPWPSGLPSLHGGKGDDIGLNSSPLWVPDGEKAMQPLNFQGFGMTSWLQPRIDASMFGLQPNLYQAMAAAALQEMRAVGPSKETSAMLQFQKPQNMPSISAPPLASNVLQQMLPQSQQTLLQTVQESQTSNPNQCQPQFQQSNPLRNHQQQHLQPPQFQQQQVSGQQDQLQHQQLQHKHFTNHQQVPSSVPTLSQIDFTSESQSSSLPTVSSFYQQQNLPDTSVANVPTSGVSPFQGIMHSFSPDANKILSLPRTSALISSSEWSSPKRLAVEPMLSPGAPSVQPQADQLGAQTNISQQSVRFQSFSERDCSIGQECNTDPQNHQLFGVNIDSSSLLIQNGMSSLRSIAIEPTSTLFLSNVGTNFPLNHNLSNSSCLEGSGLLQTPENMGHDNPQHGTFVKVYKSGSFGRSLDITKFNSYPELRSELGRLFGLDGQLEDPLRSGWQLVFVDRENDILLLGDDPWHEFVNNVWCIKILSPEEVQQMGTDGADLLSSAPVKKHPGASCDEYAGKRDLRMASLGSLYY